MADQNKDITKTQLGDLISCIAATYRSMCEGYSQGQKWLKHSSVAKIPFQHEGVLMSPQTWSMVQNL